MKTIKIFYTLLTGVILLVLAACNKGEDDFLYKGDMLPVTIKGYNGSSEQLIVKIDTFSFKYPIPGMQTVNQSDAYTFMGSQNTAKLTITEKSSGKLVLERELRKEEKNVVVNIVYIDGKVIPFDPPTPDPNTNKVGLYVINKENNNATDVRLIDEDNMSVLTNIGNNVTPNMWNYFDVNYKTNAPYLLTIFYKTGTDKGYFNNDVWSSYIVGSPFFPINGTKGSVRCFLILYDTSRRSTTYIQVQ